MRSMVIGNLPRLKLFQKVLRSRDAGGNPDAGGGAGRCGQPPFSIRLVDRQRLRFFPKSDSTGRGGTGQPIPSGFWGQKYFGVTAIHEEGTPVGPSWVAESTPGGPPHPPKGERLPSSVGVAAHSEYFPTKRSSFENLASIRESFAYPRAEGPRPQRNESEPDPNVLDQIIGTSCRCGSPEWNYKTIAASAAPGAVTALLLQTFRIWVIVRNVYL